MLKDDSLTQLAQNVTPSDALKRAAKRNVMNRIAAPKSLTSLIKTATPGSAFAQSLKQRVLSRLSHPFAPALTGLVPAVQMNAARQNTLKHRILSRIEPITHASTFHVGLKWAAAFAVLILGIRSLPFAFLPPTQADTGIQLIPNGEQVSVYAGGVWRLVTTPEILTGPVMIRTESSRATVILGDDGVMRLAPDTTLKLHAVASRSHVSSAGPTATLVRGEVWMLGLLPPVLDPLTMETSHGTLSVNAGSTSVGDDGKEVTVSMFDRGASFRYEKQLALLVTGEKLVTHGSELVTSTLPARTFSNDWAAGNLEQDAVHRAEIAKLQQQRRQEMASILPTDILYPAKRIAEEVDVFFTLTHDGRAAKRIEQADTRLSEAMALLNDGKKDEAAVPLSEFQDSLIALAGSDGDNLVKSLVRERIADASASLNDPSSQADNTNLVRSAVLDVTAAIPDTALKTKDIEGYVLVDKIASINDMLRTSHNLTGAVMAYADVQPFLKSLLAEEDGTHPLLQKEAQAMLVTTSSLIKDEAAQGTSAVVDAIQTDVAQYLPAEPEKVLASEEELNARVAAMVARILVFKAPRSRYNQLMQEMTDIKNDPDRGTLLRRLHSALPEDGVGGYVSTAIKELGDELKTK
jgi:hypothetical protein